MFTPFSFNDKLKIKVGDRVLSVGQLPAPVQMYHLNRIQTQFKTINALKDKGNLLIQYKRIIDEVWDLVKQSASWWSRFRVKGLFYSKCYSDIGWMLDVINEIHNYWLWLGKWIASLSEGQTLQMMNGKGLTDAFIAKDLARKTSENYLTKKLSLGFQLKSN